MAMDAYAHELAGQDIVNIEMADALNLTYQHSRAFLFIICTHGMPRPKIAEHLAALEKKFKGLYPVAYEHGWQGDVSLFDPLAEHFEQILAAKSLSITIYQAHRAIQEFVTKKKQGAAQLLKKASTELENLPIPSGESAGDEAGLKKKVREVESHLLGVLQRFAVGLSKKLDPATGEGHDATDEPSTEGSPE
jgi:hypothetical protein